MFVFILSFFWGHKSFFWDHRYPCCGRVVMSALCFKAKVDSLVCILCHLHETDSLDSSLVRHLLTSWQPAWQLSCFIYILVFKHWWGSSLGSSMALPPPPPTAFDKSEVLSIQLRRLGYWIYFLFVTALELGAKLRPALFEVYCRTQTQEQ